MTSQVVGGNSNSNDPESKDFEIQLGESLLKAGLLTPTQLTQAMWEKTETPLRLEEICIEHGWILPEVLYSFIPSQLLRLGAILFLYGFLNIEQLRDLLSEQRKHPGRRLGEILIEQGWISEEALPMLLSEQEKIRQLAHPNSWELMSKRRLKVKVKDFLFDPSQANTKKQTPQQLITSYKYQIHVLENQLDIKQREFDSISAEFTQQIESLKLQIQQSSIEVKSDTETESRLQELQQRLQTTQIDLQSQQLTNRHFSEDIRRYKQEIEALNQQLVQLQREKDTLTARLNQKVDQLESQLQAAQGVGGNQSFTEQHLRQQVADLEHRHQELQTALQEYQWQNQLLNENRKEDHETLQAWSNYQVRVEAEMRRLKDQLNQATDQLSHAEGSSQRYVEQLQSAQAQVDKTHSSNARLISELAEARRQKVEIEYQLQTQEQASQEQAEQLKAMKQKVEQEREKLAAIVLQSQEQQAVSAKQVEELEEKLNKQIANNRKLVARLKKLEPNRNTYPPITDTTDQVQDIDSSTPKASASEVEQLTTEEREILSASPASAQRLLARLRLADLIGIAELRKVLSTWERRGGQLADSIVYCTRVKPDTIKFFTEENMTTKLQGAASLSDYLLAAGLVNSEQLSTALKSAQSGQSISEILVEQGMIRPATANYFIRQFSKPAK